MAVLLLPRVVTAFQHGPEICTKRSPWSCDDECDEYGLTVAIGGVGA